MPAVTCTVIDTPAQRSRVHALITKQYQAQGYSMGSEHEGIAAFVNGPQAKSWGLYLGSELFGTVSLVGDTPQGLPMDSLYHSELAPLRSRGPIAEVGRFAVDHQLYKTLTKRDAPFVAAPLFKAVLAHALSEGIDYLCIAINPKHDRFYETLGFAKIGDLKQYAAVDAPAIARAFFVPEWQQSSLLRSIMQ